MDDDASSLKELRGDDLFEFEKALVLHTLPVPARRV